MRISVWSSDVCSSDLRLRRDPLPFHGAAHPLQRQPFMGGVLVDDDEAVLRLRDDIGAGDLAPGDAQREAGSFRGWRGGGFGAGLGRRRSEEHTSELQSLMRISYAVFCLKKNNTYIIQPKVSTTYAEQS